MSFVLHQLLGHGRCAMGAEGDVGDRGGDDGSGDDGGVAFVRTQSSVLGIIDFLEDLKVIVILLLRFLGVFFGRC